MNLPPGYRIVIHESVITSFTLPGGSVFKFVHELSRDTASEARLRAPRRTGELAASIEGRRPVTTKIGGCAARVYAHAHYAMWVHEGTGPVIVPTHHNYMRLPPWGRWPLIFAQIVRGQDPQPFLADAMRSTLRRHGLL